MGYFSWSFFLLTWNLMARSVTVANIMLAHISWREDSLLIEIPKTKADQGGD